jgi:hypothetical protein
MPNPTINKHNRVRKRTHPDIRNGLQGTGTNGNYVSIPSLASYTVPDNWSLQMWVKPPVSGSKSAEGLFTTNITNVTTNWIEVGLTAVANNWEFICNVRNSAGTVLLNSLSFGDSSISGFESIRTGQNKERILLTITQTKNGSNYEYRLYKNKFLRSTTTGLTTKPTTFSGFFFLSDRGVASRNSSFQLGNVRFYENYVMSDTEVTASYNDGFGAKCVSTPLFNIPFKYSYTSGGNFYSDDLSVNANRAQIIGFSTPLTTTGVFKDDDMSGRVAVYVDGNSMVQNGLGLEWVTYSLGYFADNYFVVNVGVSTKTIAELIVDAPTKLDPLQYYTRYWGKKILVFWEGSNGLRAYGNITPGATAIAATNADYATYRTARRNAGFQKLMHLTIISRKDGATYAQFETDRLTVNTNQLALVGVAGGWDAAYDVAADVHFQDANDTTYFQADKVHPVTTANGYPAIALPAKNVAITM